MTSPDMAYGFEISHLHGGQNIGHLAAENRELVRQVEVGNRFKPDAVGEEIETFGNFAQWRIAGHRCQLGEKLHVQLGESLGVRVVC